MTEHSDSHADDTSDPNDNFSGKRGKVLSLYDAGLQELGEENCPTRKQVAYALDLGIDPTGKYRFELSDIIAAAQSKEVDKQRRGYLHTLFSEDVSSIIDAIDSAQLDHVIAKREAELMEQFPIGAHIRFGDVQGTIGGYSVTEARFLYHRFSLQGGNGRSTHSMKNLLNATRTPGHADGKIAAMPDLTKRVADRIQTLLRKKEFIDLHTATKKTNRAVMNAIKSLVRRDKMDPTTVTDSEIDELIQARDGETY